MDYPYTIKVKVSKMFGDCETAVAFYSGLTTFVGTNASGKTQTLKAIRDKLKDVLGKNRVRYLSSNRMGNMEQYRSRTNQYTHYSAEDYTFGDQKSLRRQSSQYEHRGRSGYPCPL